MTSAVDINGNVLNPGDTVIVPYCSVIESIDTRATLRLPNGDTWVADSNTLEKVGSGSIAAAIAAAVGPLSVTLASLVDGNGNPLTTEFINGKRVLATSGRQEKLLSQVIGLLLDIKELLASK